MIPLYMDPYAGGVGAAYRRSKLIIQNPDFIVVKRSKLPAPEWQPDTRVGSVPVGSIVGMTCANKQCNEFFQYAEANQPNGKFLCRRCRK